MTKTEVQKIAREEAQKYFTGLMKSCVNLIELAKEVESQDAIRPKSVKLPKNWGKIHGKPF